MEMQQFRPETDADSKQQTIPDETRSSYINDYSSHDGSYPSRYGRTESDSSEDRRSIKKVIFINYLFYSPNTSKIPPSHFVSRFLGAKQNHIHGNQKPWLVKI